MVGLLVIGANLTPPAQAAGRPDLVVSSISAPTTKNAGQVLTVTSTVKNRGTARAASSRVRTWLSTDTTAGNTGDRLLGTRYVTALAAGRYVTGKTSYTLPTTIRKGRWNLIVCADATRLLRESVETNNCRVRAFYVNRPPVANNDTVSGTEDAAKVISAATLLANDTDPDPVKTLVVTGVFSGTGGIAELSGSTITFTPEAGRTTPASFAYTARDSLGLTDTAVVTVNLANANDSPVAGADASSTFEDTPKQIQASTLLSNDSDLDGNTLTVTGVSNPVRGTVGLVGSTVTFTPAANEVLDGSFSYTVSDGAGGEATATVTVDITPVNDAPLALDDQAVTQYETQMVLPTSSLLANDIDVDGDALTLTFVSDQDHGTVSLNGDYVLFTPDAGFSGTAGFNYTVSDPGSFVDSGHVTITVRAQNIIQTSVSSVLVTEGSSNTVGVKLAAQPQASVFVSVDSSDTAKFTASPTGLTFTTANWDTLQTVTLSGTEDVNLTGDAATLVLTSPGAPTKQVSVSITDNDTQAIIGPAGPLSVDEGGDLTVNVHLAYQPAMNVTMSISSSSTANATVSPSTLQFTPANYAEDQSVTLHGTDDFNFVNGATTLTFSLPGGVTLSYNVTVYDTGCPTC